MCDHDLRDDIVRAVRSKGLVTGDDIAELKSHCDMPEVSNTQFHRALNSATHKTHELRTYRPHGNGWEPRSYEVISS